jgi:hypothetical protein
MKTFYIFKFKPSLLRGCLMIFLLGVAGVSAQTAQPLPEPPTIHWPEPEPERWTQEDLTLEQRFETARKETLAAYQEAMNTCKAMHPTEQADCTSEAKAQLELELAQLKAKARFGFEPN